MFLLGIHDVQDDRVANVQRVGERRKYCCDCLLVPNRSLLHKGEHNIPKNACVTEKKL